jgi:alkyl hydroperoxide reductase subunit AhpC
MIELGQLEARHEDFAKRNLRVIVVSNDDQKTSKETQADFPHLLVVSDEKQNLAKAVEVIHAGAGHDHKDTNAPTTFLVDGGGKVRWFYRPERVVTRLSPDELLAKVDAAGAMK